MKVLFAVNNDNVSEAIAKKYEREYKDILSYKNVYYFNAIIRELQKDKTYNRVVISEDLEPFANNNYDMIDKFLLEKYTNISREAKALNEEKIEVILLCADRRKKTEDMFIKLYNLEIFSAIIGQDRSIEEVCKLIYSPRDKNIAKQYYEIPVSELTGQDDSENNVSEAEVENILAHYKRLGRNEDKYVDSFNNIISQYTDVQLKIIIRYLPIHVKAVLEERSPKYQQLVTTGLPGQNGNFEEKTNKYKQKAQKKSFWKSKNNNDDIDDEDEEEDAIIDKEFTTQKMSKPIVIPSDMNTENVQKINVPNAQNDIFEEMRLKTMDREEPVSSEKVPEPISQNTINQVQQIPEPSIQKEQIPMQQIVESPIQREQTPVQQTVEQPIQREQVPVQQTVEPEIQREQTQQPVEPIVQEQVRPIPQQIERPDIKIQDVPVPQQIVTPNIQTQRTQENQNVIAQDLQGTSQPVNNVDTTPVQEIGEDLFDGLLDAESEENLIQNTVTNNQEAEPVKRGRGRPRTKPIVEIDPNQPKRGRGRPRTKPIVEVDPNQPKRGRGRPKKQVITEISGQIQGEPLTTMPNHIENVESNNIEQETDLFNISEEVQEINPVPANEEVTQPVNDELIKSVNSEAINSEMAQPINNVVSENTNIVQTEDVDLFSMEETEPEKEEPLVDLFDVEENSNAIPEPINETNMQASSSIQQNEIESTINQQTNIEEQRPIEIQEEEKNNYQQVETEPDLFNVSDANAVNLFEENNNITTTNKTTEYSSLNTLLTSDKKIVAFVGTTKNGTSFIVNNTAEMLSSMGISTAIIDMTKSKNAYYIYTNNEEELRSISTKCMKNLENGIAEGIKINKTLTVYTEMPGEVQNYNLDAILSTLVQNYSAVLIDTDFDTPIEIFEKVQEIYLVQSMDVLTIQPLTAFLRNLKSKNILKPEKLRIVINKSQRIKSLNVKTLIGGMSCYNAPNMSYMTELFDKDSVRYCEIPFEVQNYIKYLESLVTCEISLNGYTKALVASLKELANVVYPLIGKQTYSPMNGNNKKDPFSKQMSNTLNKMKKGY